MLFGNTFLSKQDYNILIANCVAVLSVLVRVLHCMSLMRLSCKLLWRMGQWPNNGDSNLSLQL